ncbi:twin-arginine translocase TatA/TatE family subunit [Patescibacteria group bacterium]|nr:twin-arginine translocase TatA/TatE family subunit [Patescibacteria group bacterium]MBU0777030.1 twin-arginine translocase TatA/TatE family subunit [Patescibacteria group bacterium]MBU0846188.1 twin-arginine translocase TatA/TatE family subunit [Patescibacteria group bacterium]MBU0923101.1 twin-arginine translocase TatA/TatE family subunit [Patescibacteria group bacterium]MBU1066567.1 twin-arginine translocase TatA/TatE family subunit [Patescibacteria group bacterium]
MFGIGVQELVVVLVIVLVLFGGKKLPELSKGLGEAIKNIRMGFGDDENKKQETSKEKSKK